METKNNVPPKLPPQGEHFFTEVSFDVVPEVNYHDLVFLSKIVIMKGESVRYFALRDALRKYQWAKLAGLEAIDIERKISSHMKPNIIPVSYIGQARHAKAMIECVTHTKAALDSLAVFLTDYFTLPAQGAKRDLKLGSFRELVMQKDITIGNSIKSIESWLNDLVPRRDMWIHWSSPMIPLVVGSSEVGVLPVQKKLVEYQASGSSFDREHYWSTQEFVELHTSTFSQFFCLVVKRCIEIEVSTLSTVPRRSKVVDAAWKASYFPMQVTENMHFNKMLFLGDV